MRWLGPLQAFTIATPLTSCLFSNPFYMPPLLRIFQQHLEPFGLVIIAAFETKTVRARAPPSSPIYDPRGFECRL